MPNIEREILNHKHQILNNIKIQKERLVLNFEDMQKVKGVLEDRGLHCVICQTEFGIIGP